MLVVQVSFVQRRDLNCLEMFLFKYKVLDSLKELKAHLIIQEGKSGRSATLQRGTVIALSKHHPGSRKMRVIYGTYRDNAFTKCRIFQVVIAKLD